MENANTKNCTVTVLFLKLNVALYHFLHLYTRLETEVRVKNTRNR